MNKPFFCGLFKEATFSGGGGMYFELLLSSCFRRNCEVMCKNA